MSSKYSWGKNDPKIRLSALGWKTWPRLNATTLRTRQRKWCWICLKHILTRFSWRRWVKRRPACWRIFCCWKMSDRSYFASWLDPFQTGGIASLLLLTLWQNLRRYSFFKSILCAGMAGNYHFCSPAWEWVWPMLDMEFLSPLIPHTSEIVKQLFYKVWATPQAALLLLHAPLSGHLLGWSVLCLLPGFFNRMLRFWSKSVGVSR